MITVPLPKRFPKEKKTWTPGAKTALHGKCRKERHKYLPGRFWVGWRGLCTRAIIPQGTREGTASGPFLLEHIFNSKFPGGRIAIRSAYRPCENNKYRIISGKQICMYPTHRSSMFGRRVYQEKRTKKQK